MVAFQDTLPGSPSTAPSLCAAVQGALQHGFPPGMVAYHPGPPGFYPQQLLYYPAGMAPYQQPAMGAGVGGPHWAAVRGPGLPGPPPRQQGGGGMPGGMAVQARAGGYPHPLQGPYFYPGPGAMPMAPLTPAVSGSQQRQVPMTRSGSSTSASSTGWGGVPLSQSAVDMVAAGVAPSPRGSPRQHAADSRVASGAAAEVSAASSYSAGSSRAAHKGHGGAPTPQAAAEGAAEPEGEASKLESASQAGPSSSGSDDLGEEPAEGGGPGSSGGEGGGSGGPRSSPGGSSSSRRSRGSRERQVWVGVGGASVERGGGRTAGYSACAFRCADDEVGAAQCSNVTAQRRLLWCTTCRNARSTSRRAPVLTGTGKHPQRAWVGCSEGAARPCLAASSLPGAGHGACSPRSADVCITDCGVK